MTTKKYGKDGSGKVRTAFENARQSIASDIVDIATEGRRGLSYVKKKYINDADIKRKQQEVIRVRKEREKKYTD